jgi:Carboxypeptidase regulatory-like domain
MRNTLRAAIAVLLCGAIDAAEVQVRVMPHDGAVQCVANASVIATSSSESVRTAVAKDGSARLKLPEASVWDVRVEADRCWSESQTWSSDQPGDLTLRLYRAGAVEGVLEPPKGTVLDPGAVRGTVYLEGVETHCALAESQWRCAAPAGVPFDLRLDVPGFASLHYWDVVASADGVRELEPQPLRAGAAVSGWVQSSKEVALADARVSIFPLQEQSAGTSARSARLRTARTNRKGFFQLAGLAPGRYRLVSEAPGLSPVVVPELEIREADKVTLPRPIRHDPYAEAELVLEPAVDHAGRPWMVELTEVGALFPGKRPVTIAREAAKDGRWIAQRLRADAYDVTVRDKNGTIVHRAQLDLFGGKRGFLQLTIQPAYVRGVVRAGNEPVRADLDLWSAGGTFVRVSTDDDGRFEATLPARGAWSVTVLYPPDGASARINAPGFTIPSDPEAQQEITIDLPGGRVRGEVVTAGGTPARAAVHVQRNGRVAGQQITDENGRFDIIGLFDGAYEVDAQTEQGSTVHPLQVVLAENETREVKLVTEPYTRLALRVMTPDGRPASGAVIKLSTDGGTWWTDGIADVNGHFERSLPRSGDLVQLVVLTYDYPAAFLSARTGNSIEVRLRNDGGIIRFGSALPTVAGHGVSVPANVLYFPFPHGRFNGGIHVQSGSYLLCAQGRSRDACKNVTVQPGSDQTIDLNGGDAPAAPETL